MPGLLSFSSRIPFQLAIAGLLLLVAGISSISALDPSGASLRLGMILMTLGASIWLQRVQLAPAVVLIWLLPSLGRSLSGDYTLFGLSMLLELPGLLALGFFGAATRDALVPPAAAEQTSRIPEAEPGILDESQLIASLRSELARSRRFGHTFALVFVGIDERRQRFDYRDEAAWQESVIATQHLLTQTRQGVDRVFHYGNDGSYAMLLPESTEKDVRGMVQRLRRIARSAKPAEGEPGGPLPVHFGATFYPECATTVEDLVRRAEVAMRLAEKSTSRVQLDGAEAPEPPPVETLRRNVEDAAPAPPVEPVAVEPSPAPDAEPAVAVLSAAEAVETPEAPQSPPVEPPAPAREKPGDELGRMLEQMNATLDLIKSVRAQS